MIILSTCCTLNVTDQNMCFIQDIFSFNINCKNGNNKIITQAEERQSAYCEQVHDGVTGLSKQGLSEADAEQWTWVDCKPKYDIH